MYLLQKFYLKIIKKSNTVSYIAFIKLDIGQKINFIIIKQGIIKQDTTGQGIAKQGTTMQGIAK